MVSRSVVGWWIVTAVLLLAAEQAQAQSSASFPDDPKKPVPAPAAPTAPPAPAPAPAAPAPAPAVTPPPPPLSPDSLRGPSPPIATPGPVDDVRYPVRSAAPPSSDAPPLLPYREGMPIPKGYTLVDRPATGLIAAGLVGLGVAYTTGLIVAASQGFENGTGLLAIPVIGPYAAIGTREYNCTIDTVDAAKRC
ncbi:MAG TPA: hypothetical protein VFZ53_22920, partial [Polyangiaceae bacterium]